jgi:hypothetical protein
MLTVRQLAEREGYTERHVRVLLQAGLPHFDRCGIKIRLSEYLAWMAHGRRTVGKKP